MKTGALIFGLCLLTLTATSQDKILAIDSLMSHCHAKGLFNGNVLISDSGKLVYEKSFGLANLDEQTVHEKETKFLIGSVSKQFTAAIILLLYEKRLLGLTDPVSMHLPEFEGTPNVTIHHLLSHTSGIPDFTSQPGYWSDSIQSAHDSLKILEFASGDQLFEAGSDYQYNNTGYYLLALIAERVSGNQFWMQGGRPTFKTCRIE